MMYDQLYEFGRQRAKFTAWVVSDGHSCAMDEEKQHLDVIMRDYESLDRPADMIWYLGDAVLGDGVQPDYPPNADNVLTRAACQLEAIDKLGIPLCYVTGNHEYDYVYGHREGHIELPFYSEVRRHKGWFTTERPEDTWFRIKVRNTMVYFFSDHMASDASWLASGNAVAFGAEKYPYGPSHFEAIRRDMAACGAEHIITASHYALPGGFEDTKLLSLLQPLPRSVRLHLYGHTHVGHYSGKEQTFTQIQWVNWQDIPQVNISSLDGAYGKNYRSVFLQMYEDDSLGLFFRNHSTGKFYAAFFPSDRSGEPEGGYEQHAVKIDPATVLPPQCPGMIREGFTSAKN